MKSVQTPTTQPLTGSGKSTFAKKVMALVRSKGRIALGCASTGLAAQVYGQGEFETAHSLFGIPVIEGIYFLYKKTILIPAQILKIMTMNFTTSKAS